MRWVILLLLALPLMSAELDNVVPQGGIPDNMVPQFGIPDNVIPGQNFSDIILKEKTTGYPKDNSLYVVFGAVGLLMILGAVFVFYKSGAK
jgi:LPXTG-motif cell wall-anchored protein